ncbi:hypothetical protein PRO82_000292 [Candidatus Protochlamydia amoebophila]|nr:hypothetical protein [Candidatus Protochlamydia amoebophila]
MHAKLAAKAKFNGISLNNYISQTLKQAIQ